jgi:branched-chain amino acid transport system ATP-binding protein
VSGGPAAGPGSGGEGVALLTLDGVTAGYLADIDVLRNVSLSIERGRITGLIGLNGAGKSTLMKTICGFVRPHAGAIRYGGDDITGIPPHRLIDRGIWYIPQESSLFPYMTVADNLRLPLQRLSRAARNDDGGERGAGLATRYDAALARFPALAERTRTPAGNLSGGQQKMLELAKAWVVRPRLCLVDEPSVGLAPIVAAEVYRWIERFAAEGMTILLVDHNVRRVVKLSEYVYVLSLGEITARGRREDFQGDLHEQVKAWLGVNF